MRAKAEALPSGNLSQSANDPTVWSVVSTRTGKAETVQVLEQYVSCTCTHGKNSPGQAHCYHACAVELALEADQESGEPTTGKLPIISFTD